MALRERTRYLLDPQEFAWLTGYELTGMTLTKVGVKFRLIIRATCQSRGPLYLLVVAATPLEALEEAYRTATHRGGSVFWYTDRYST